MIQRPMIWAVVWFGLVLGSVGLGLISGDYFGESMCGVWGCFSPVQAPASLHLLWLLVLAPPTLIFAHYLPDVAARRAGVMILILGLLSIACVVAGGLADWSYSPSDPYYLGYTIRRAGFSLATRTDVPALPIAVTGLAVLVAARRLTKPSRPASVSMYRPK